MAPLDCHEWLPEKYITMQVKWGPTWPPKPQHARFILSATLEGALREPSLSEMTSSGWLASAFLNCSWLSVGASGTPAWVKNAVARLSRASSLRDRLPSDALACKQQPKTLDQ